MFKKIKEPPVVLCGRCQTLTLLAEQKWDGYCSHCDEPCQHFPECLCCAMSMEPNEVGLSISALALMWKAADERPNEWWESSEFGPSMKK